MRAHPFTPQARRLGETAGLSTATPEASGVSRLCAQVLRGPCHLGAQRVGRM